MITIRKATTRDAGIISTIGVASWKAAYQGIVPAACLDNLTIVDKEATVSKDLANPQVTFLVAEIDTEPVGMACFHPTSHETRSQEAWEIGALYVLPEHWRNGVGGMLLRTAMESMKYELDVVQCDVWVFAANGRARAFYEKHGFELTEFTEQHTLGGETIPAVCYSRQSDSKQSNQE